MDSYGNKIKFLYQHHPVYGTVLSTIEDEVGNRIQITYSQDQVLIQQGNKQVIYWKIQQNGKELLSQVVDPKQLVTTYHYQIKAA